MLRSRNIYWKEFGAAEIWCESVPQLNITIVKSYFDPNKFENILIENIRQIKKN